MGGNIDRSGGYYRLDKHSMGVLYAILCAMLLGAATGGAALWRLSSLEARASAMESRVANHGERLSHLEGSRSGRP